MVDCLKPSIIIDYHLLPLVFTDDTNLFSEKLNFYDESKEWVYA